MICHAFFKALLNSSVINNKIDQQMINYICNTENNARRVQSFQRRKKKKQNKK